jgi:hypothetical protein
MKATPKFTCGPIAPGSLCDGGSMKDMQAQLDSLREQASECARIASKATDAAKQELFARLAQHFTVLASEVEKAIAKMAGEE